MWPFAKGADPSRPRALPLFPLHTVLFPGGVLPLKIFEQRYIDMAKACLADNSPFGVVLLTQGEEVAQTDSAALEFAPIGTIAQITNWDMPQLGILHVTTVGATRFKVEAHATGASGLIVGEVRAIADEPKHSLPEQHAPLARLLELIAARVGPQNFPAERAFDDASWVGYRLAEMLPLPLHIKQSMLEINDAGVRLNVLAKFLLQQGLIS
jgi:Lon protease-like protein